MKRIISVILTIAMVLGISMETFAAYGGEKSCAYQSNDCTITYSITNELISKYGMEMKELPSLAGDNVVEVYSQFGLQYRSGSFLDSIKTYKSHMFITINQLYTPLNCYHNEILTNLQMQEIVLQYLVE